MPARLVARAQAPVAQCGKDPNPRRGSLSAAATALFVVRQASEGAVLARAVDLESFHSRLQFCPSSDLRSHLPNVRIRHAHNQPQPIGGERKSAAPGASWIFMNNIPLPLTPLGAVWPVAVHSRPVPHHDSQIELDNGPVACQDAMIEASRNMRKFRMHGRLTVRTR